jgi:DNA phosphorothioation-dependent restriction protein DptG
MSSPAINTVIKMMESLPEDKQDKIVEHLREYIQDLQEEQKWNESFNKTQDKLIAATRLAKQQIAQGKATPMDYNKL